MCGRLDKVDHLVATSRLGVSVTRMMHAGAVKCCHPLYFILS